MYVIPLYLSILHTVLPTYAAGVPTHINFIICVFFLELMYLHSLKMYSIVLSISMSLLTSLILLVEYYELKNANPVVTVVTSMSL